LFEDKSFFRFFNSLAFDIQIIQCSLDPFNKPFPVFPQTSVEYRIRVSLPFQVLSVMTTLSNFFIGVQNFAFSGAAEFRTMVENG
jgi:hypothetical protein